MVRNGPEWSEMVRNGPERSGMIQNGYGMNPVVLSYSIMVDLLVFILVIIINYKELSPVFEIVNYNEIEFSMLIF